MDPLGLFVICISKDSYQISVIGGAEIKRIRIMFLKVTIERDNRNSLEILRYIKGVVHRKEDRKRL